MGAEPHVLDLAAQHRARGIPLIEALLLAIGPTGAVIADAEGVIGWELESSAPPYVPPHRPRGHRRKLESFVVAGHALEGPKHE
jgi:hypothetical protein